MRFWISWNEPVDETEDYRPLTVPVDERVKAWWCSGFGDSYATLCAVVDADSGKDAKEAVRLHWRPMGWRFINEVEADWRPGSRFPWPAAEEGRGLEVLGE